MGLSELENVMVGGRAEPAEAGRTVQWKIVPGLDPKYWDQLIDYSTTDELVLRNTRDAKRFKNGPAIEEWLLKGRMAYTITDPTGEQLLGLYWFGPETIPTGKEGEEVFTFTEPINVAEYPITNARRIYGPLRGQRQSAAIFREVFSLFTQTDMFIGGIWTETSYDNEGVLKVDYAHGFKKVTEVNPNHKVILVASKDALQTSLRTVVPAPRSGRRS